MPSLSRRREQDFRAERLESELGDPQAAQRLYQQRGTLQVCQACGHAYEEYSKHCPRCDRKTMATLKPIPSQHLAEAERNALRRSRERLGL